MKAGIVQLAFTDLMTLFQANKPTASISIFLSSMFCKSLAFIDPVFSLANLHVLMCIYFIMFVLLDLYFKPYHKCFNQHFQFDNFQSRVYGIAGQYSLLGKHNHLKIPLISNSPFSLCTFLYVWVEGEPLLEILMLSKRWTCPGLYLVTEYLNFWSISLGQRLMIEAI